MSKRRPHFFFQNNLTFVIQMLGESGVISTTREIRLHNTSLFSLYLEFTVAVTL
jgi:hypothetical protein